VNFEWDSDKAASNQQKHGVTFHEAATVFGDPVAITFSDPDHSARESRYLTVGMSQSARILIVSHTDRGENVRIISARKTTRSERRFYEEGK
jgi:uncharacterized DUF497 family protein